MEDTSIHMDIHQVCNCVNAAKQHLLHQGQEALPNAPPSWLLLLVCGISWPCRLYAVSRPIVDRSRIHDLHVPDHS